MTAQDSEFWDKAADVREQLAEQYAEDPAVTLVDIGCPPDADDDGDAVGVRIHMSDAWCAENSPDEADVQTEIEGIPVYVLCDEVTEQ